MSTMPKSGDLLRRAERPDRGLGLVYRLISDMAVKKTILTDVIPLISVADGQE